MARRGQEAGLAATARCDVTGWRIDGDGRRRNCCTLNTTPAGALGRLTSRLTALRADVMLGRRTKGRRHRLRSQHRPSEHLPIAPFLSARLLLQLSVAKLLALEVAELLCCAVSQPARRSICCPVWSTPQLNIGVAARPALRYPLSNALIGIAKRYGKPDDASIAWQLTTSAVLSASRYR